jgi:hypothetical protein
VKFEPLPIPMTIREKYAPAMNLTVQEDADAYFEACVEHNMRWSKQNNEPRSRQEAEVIERSNLGYFAGYYSNEVRERVEKLFKCAHPVFGAVAVCGAPTIEQAFNMGLRAGEQAKRDLRH